MVIQTSTNMKNPATSFQSVQFDHTPDDGEAGRHALITVCLLSTWHRFDTYSLHGFTDSELCQACGDKQKQRSAGVLVAINNSPLERRGAVTSASS